MKRLVAFLCLAALLAVPAAEAQTPARQKRDREKCTLKTCGCDVCLPRERFENDDPWKKSQVCWCELAQVNITENSVKAHAQCLARVYAQARKTGKIVLYIGNTGG
jgi:hypothetical protein